MSNLKTKVVSELSKIKREGVHSVISKKEDYKIVNMEIIRFLTNNIKNNGVYVSLCRAHCSVVKEFENQKINIEKIIFIDNNEEGNGCGAHNCIFLGRNKSLTSLSLAITEACNDNAVKFIVLDSIDILLVYHDLELTKRFVHYFINKIKNLGILTIIILVEEPNSDKLMSILFQLSDGVINL